MKKHSLIIVLTLLILIPYLYSQNSEQTQRVNSASNYQNITLSIDSLLSNYNLTKTQYSLAVYSLNSKKFIYEKNADLQLKPASVTKLFTSFATYWLVGDTFNFRTIIYTDDTNIKDGIINGNLYIVGGGDCLMELANLDEMIRQIQNQGIKKITGNIIGDGRLYNGENNRFAYSGDNDEVEPVAPISALSIEQNRFKILLNSRVNTKQPKIQIIPNAANVQIVSNVKISSPPPAKKKTTKKKSSSNFQILQQNYGDRIPFDISLLAASRTRVSAHSTLQENGTQVIYISGSMPKNSNTSVQEFILSPTLSFASVFRNRLINNGISVLGKFAKALKTDKIDYSKMKEIAEFSRPINDVIQLLNKNSDNFIAENLFKFNGAIARRDTETVVSAKIFYDSLFATFIQSNQLPILNDGSGLSRRNKASAKSIVQLLEKASQSNFFKSYLSTLSIAGVDGTLAKRMRGTAAANNLMAKTGTHRDVSSLAGYTNTLDGEIFLFAFVFNGSNVGIYKQLENDISSIISNYTSYIPNAK